jgi:L,D-peptidoglycan transpeptidase YkuD (ErfK/YbiS/YcfS/YnhG family)
MRTKSVVRLLAISRRACRGQVQVGNRLWPCALGRSGQIILKREGDGATPRGIFPLRTVYFRADRMLQPPTAAPLTRLRKTDGWCDAPGDRKYNRIVKHPYPASAERLWRDDHVYDIIAVIGHNDRPRLRGRGSAIFIHAARQDYTPTEGCIALSLPHLKQLLRLLRLGTQVQI